MHSGVASPPTPDLEKLSAVRSGTAKKNKMSTTQNPHVRPLFVSPRLHGSLMRPFFGALFWWSLSDPSGDLSHFMSALMQTGLREKDTQSPPPPVPGTADCLAVWPESLH